MRPATVSSVRREVERGAIAPVYYLTGDADVLKEEFTGRVIESVLAPATRDFNLDIRNAGDLDPAELHTLIETLPVFAERRVVVIKGLEQWRPSAKTWEVLARYLERPSQTTVLVLLHGAGEEPDGRLLRAAVHLDFRVPGAEGVRAWVAERAERQGLAMEPEALEHLIRVVGPDLARLRTELDKLAAAYGAAGPLSETQVALLVGVHRGETVDDWVEAVVRRDWPWALALTDVVLPQAGVTAVRMVMALGTELIGLRLARALAEGGAAGPRLEGAILEHLRRIRPAGVRNWATQARIWATAAAHWSGPALARAIRATYQADRALKATTVSDDRATLRTLVLSLAATEQAA